MAPKKTRTIPEVCLPLVEGPGREERIRWRWNYAISWRKHHAGYTLEEIANAMGVTRERVRQIIADHTPPHPKRRPRDL